MARGKSTDGDIDALGVLITASYGLDRSWAERGRCFGWRQQPSPWHYIPGPKNRHMIRDSEMVAFALLHCQSCPVQYECAAFACAGRMRACTFAMAESDLLWLTSQSDWRDILDMGAASGEPVQRVVVTVRAARESNDGTTAA